MKQMANQPKTTTTTEEKADPAAASAAYQRDLTERTVRDLLLRVHHGAGSMTARLIRSPSLSLAEKRAAFAAVQQACTVGLAAVEAHAAGKTNVDAGLFSLANVK